MLRHSDHAIPSRKNLGPEDVISYWKERHRCDPCIAINDDLSISRQPSQVLISSISNLL